MSKPLPERSMEERKGLLEMLGVEDPDAFIAAEVKKHQSYKRRIKSAADKRKVGQIVETMVYGFYCGRLPDFY